MGFLFQIFDRDGRRFALLRFPALWLPCCTFVGIKDVVLHHLGRKGVFDWSSAKRSIQRGRKFAALMIASAINRTLIKTSTPVRRRQHTTFSYTSPRQSHQRFIWDAALLCLIC